jgi:hypothetical protein
VNRDLPKALAHLIWKWNCPVCSDTLWNGGMSPIQNRSLEMKCYKCEHPYVLDFADPLQFQREWERSE